MDNKKLAVYAFINSVGVLVYTAAVALIMSNGEKVFGQMQRFWGPVAFLMLFVLSATIVGALVLGRPVLFYLDGLKKEAIKLFIYTVISLLALTMIVFVALLML
jgi:hypothetical protein